MADTRAAEEEHVIDVRPDKGYLEGELAKAASYGDWKTAESLLKEHPEEITPSTLLGFCEQTALHIAATKGHIEFVENLVKIMDKKDLGIPNHVGNTALSIAVLCGHTQITSILLNKEPKLATMLVVASWTDKSLLPIEIAARYGKSAMVRHLYDFTNKVMEERDLVDLFLSFIHYCRYDIAKTMLSDYPGLAIQVNSKGETALYAIAGNVSIRRMWSCPQDETISELMDELLKGASERPDLIKEGTFTAAREGNSEFIRRALRLYPDQAIELDDKNHTLFHVGVHHRRVDIFNMLKARGSVSIQSCIKLMTDRERNSLLYLAAKLPFSGIEVVNGPGAALQVLQRELLWFKEVKKVQGGDPKNIESCVLLFEKEHEELRSKAEKWLTKTATSGMTVAVLFFGAAIAGLFSVPGGYKQDTGVPIHLGNSWFKTYRISYAATSLFSLSAILFFLSVLISGFPTRDFQKSLPSKLLFGLLSLVVSVVAIIMTVVAAFYLHFEHPIPHLSYPVAAVAFVLILLASFLLSPLLVKVFRSTFMPSQQFTRNRF